MHVHPMIAPALVEDHTRRLRARADTRRRARSRSADGASRTRRR